MSSLKELEAEMESTKTSVEELSDKVLKTEIQEKIGRIEKGLRNFVSGIVDPETLNMPLSEFLALDSEKQIAIRMAATARAASGETAKPEKILNSKFRKMPVHKQKEFLDTGGEILPG